MIRGHLLTGIDHVSAVKYYNKSVAKGVLKVMSKMGISTLESYRGAQIFEAIGLNQKFVDTYFTNTPTRISGIGIDEIAAEVAARHHRAFPDRPVPGPDWTGADNINGARTGSTTCTTRRPFTSFSIPRA
jgi:Glutamate synthase domain 2